MRRKTSIIATSAIAAAAILAAAFGVFRPAAPPPKAAEERAIANRYDSPQMFMEGIYAADREPAPAASALAVVPHHLVAAKSDALGMRAIAAGKPKRVVVLSPDHFGRCPKALCAADVGYETFFGKTEPDRPAVAALEASPLVADAPDLFEGEHGIYAVAPFVARYLPGVPLVPVAISSSHAWKLRKDEIADLVAAAVGPDGALVISSDFSHYLTLEKADALDSLTEKALMTGDLGAIEALKQPDQSDCPACLWVAADLAASRRYPPPRVLSHTNSARILGDLRAASTTSHFAIIW